MLAEEVDYVIGVDTHKDAHTAALVNATGGVVSGVEVVASDSGYRRLLRLAGSSSR
jgi:transposase